MVWLVGWLVVFYAPSTARSFRDGTPIYLLSLAKDVKLCFYTVPTGNRTPDGRVAVHYTTAVPCQLHIQNTKIPILKLIISFFSLIKSFHLTNTHEKPLDVLL